MIQTILLGVWWDGAKVTEVRLRSAGGSRGQAVVPTDLPCLRLVG
jgi:hypothetical protein